MARNRFCALIVVLFIVSPGFAQQNEAAVSFGVTLSPSPTGFSVCEAVPICPATPVNRSVTPGFSVASEYSHRLANLRLASLHLELPVLFSPVRNSGFLNPDFSSFFFAPSLKVKLLPSSGISPFVSVGGGLARFKERSASDTRGVFQVGGGLDFKTRLPLLGFRLEARDFMTGRPDIPSFLSITSDHLHSLFVGGGITLHFGASVP